MVASLFTLSLSVKNKLHYYVTDIVVTLNHSGVLEVGKK